MKCLRGLALISAAAAASVLVIASPASATVLCKVSTTTGCAAEGQSYGVGTSVSWTLEGTSIFKSGSTTLDTCTGGRFTGKLENAGGATATVSGPNVTYDFENCVSTMHTEKLGSFEIHHIAGGDNGTLTTSGWVFGNTMFGTKCLYESGTGKDMGTLVGGATASLTVNVALNEAEPRKAICPDTQTWEARFRITSPAPLYVAAS